MKVGKTYKALNLFEFGEIKLRCLIKEPTNTRALKSGIRANTFRKKYYRTKN